VILQPKLVEPPGDSKSDYRICADLAERLGIREAFTEGRDEKDWVEWCLNVFRSTRFPELPTLDEFIEKNLGAYSNPVTNPKIAFADFRADPLKYPLNTPSGKIEIFSKQLHDMGNPNEIPAVPKYIQEWESPFAPCRCEEGDSPTKQPPENWNALTHEEVASGKEQERPRNDIYTLQAIGHHTLARVHSTHANNDWLQEAFPQRIFINPIDAAARDIHDGDLVRVWNERGELVIPARVTPRILPGVVDIPQGAWWKPDANGVDHGGCINVLTSHRWTPLAFGSAQQTIMVEVEKCGSKVEGQKSTARPSTFDLRRGPR
jgi:anaerobic dimethyl sulfoxide reductase subunit A